MLKLASGIGAVVAVPLAISLLSVTRATSQVDCPFDWDQYDCRLLEPPEADSIRVHFFYEDEWNVRFRSESEDCMHLYDRFSNLALAENIFHAEDYPGEGAGGGGKILIDNIVLLGEYAGTDIRRDTAIHETVESYDDCTHANAVSWEGYCIGVIVYPGPPPPQICW